MTIYLKEIVIYLTHIGKINIWVYKQLQINYKTRNMYTKIKAILYLFIKSTNVLICSIQLYL